MTEFGFELLGEDGQARRGQVNTAHGAIQTPAFMPVGTAATVKAMQPESVRATGAEIILGNTYHLMLRPTAERIARLGGLHKFMNWPGPILTDSGGFQVMSLSELRKLTEDGVTFRSHIDGSYHTLTPERSVEIQHLLDADITMCFDECPPYPCEKDEVARATALSMRWAKRSKDAFQARPGYGLFGITQGGVTQDDLQGDLLSIELIFGSTLRRKEFEAEQGSPVVIDVRKENDNLTVRLVVKDGRPAVGEVPNNGSDAVEE